jgi:hypothetical protein
MVARYVYLKSNGRFAWGGFYDAQPPMIAGPNDADGNTTQVPDYVNYGVVEFGDADIPDLTNDRHDATTGKRRATAQELAEVAGQLADEDAERETGNKRVMAVALALWECIPAPTMTKAQLRSRAKAIYKGLV